MRQRRHETHCATCGGHALFLGECLCHCASCGVVWIWLWLWPDLIWSYWQWTLVETLRAALGIAGLENHGGERDPLWRMLEEQIEGTW